MKSVKLKLKKDLRKMSKEFKIIGEKVFGFQVSQKRKLKNLKKSFSHFIRGIIFIMDLHKEKKK